MIFCVDDGMVDAKTSAKAEALVDLMAIMFSICKLGEPKDMLGIDISRECGAGTIPSSGRQQALAAAFGVAGR
jgi:hypothetical protein